MSPLMSDGQFATFEKL